MTTTCLAPGFDLRREVADGIVEYARQMKIGYGLDPGVEYGPMLNEEGREQTRNHVQDALERGATLLYGGKEPEGEQYSRGYYYLPTVLEGVTPDMRVMSEETFGPVAPVAAFDDLDRVIAQANSTQYGLAAYVYTRDLQRGLRFSEALESGMVGLNRALVSDPAAPFGGVKQSGLGREGGHDGLLEFMESKYIAVSW